jgi:two-component system OmpR family response regulator
MNSHTLPGRKIIRVLVVDDYPQTADYLAMALCQNEYTAIPVYSANEALSTAEQFSPDALIADLALPEMNGAELVCAFAEKFPTCRAALMTADQWTQDVFMGGRRIKVFQKPFQFAELFQFLDSAAPDATGSPF